MGLINKKSVFIKSKAYFETNFETKDTGALVKVLAHSTRPNIH